jgi:hypothetical protein
MPMSHPFSSMDGTKEEEEKKARTTVALLFQDEHKFFNSTRISIKIQN